MPSARRSRTPAVTSVGPGRHLHESVTARRLALPARARCSPAADRQLLVPSSSPEPSTASRPAVDDDFERPPRRRRSTSLPPRAPRDGQFPPPTVARCAAGPLASGQRAARRRHRHVHPRHRSGSPSASTPAGGLRLRADRRLRRPRRQRPAPRPLPGPADPISVPSPTAASRTPARAACRPSTPPSCRSRGGDLPSSRCRATAGPDRLAGRVRGRHVSPIPAVGQRPPDIATDTPARVGGKLSCSPRACRPIDALGRRSRQVLGKRPVALLFSTPQFCVSRVCGPVTDVTVALEHGSATASSSSIRRSTPTISPARACARR